MLSWKARFMSHTFSRQAAVYHTSTTTLKTNSKTRTHKFTDTHLQCKATIMLRDSIIPMSCDQFINTTINKTGSSSSSSSSSSSASIQWFAVIMNWGIYGGIVSSTVLALGCVLAACCCHPVIRQSVIEWATLNWGLVGPGGASTRESHPGLLLSSFTPHVGAGAVGALMCVCVFANKKKSPLVFSLSVSTYTLLPTIASLTNYVKPLSRPYQGSIKGLSTLY
jgi:hypothetical protein